MTQEISKKRPQDIIKWAHNMFGDGLVMSSSFGADSAVLLHMATSVVPQIPVVLIDTGYLFPETHAHVLKLVESFRLNIKIFSAGESVEKFEEFHGKLWEQGETGIRQYNNLRKVFPLESALRRLGAKAMISGVRAEQTRNRAEMDTVHLGAGNIFRIHPILRWTKKEIDEYFERHSIPRHPLVAKGYESIGDTHSTVPGKGREGRLLGQKQECGIHLCPEYEI